MRLGLEMVYSKSASIARTTASVPAAWLAQTALELVDLVSGGTGLVAVTAVEESLPLIARLVSPAVGVFPAVWRLPVRNWLFSEWTTVQCHGIVVSLPALAEVAELALPATAFPVPAVPAVPVVPAPLYHRLPRQS